MNRRAMLSCVAVLVVVAAGCGSNSPSSPSGSQAVTIQGVVLGGSGAAPLVAQSHGAQSNASTGTVTVTVSGTDHSTTVSATGTFELSTAPGDFSLVFRSDGHDLGQVGVTSATAGATVKVVVQISQHQLTVVQVKVNDEDEGEESTCAISGGKEGQSIELEGKAETALDAGTGHFTMAVNGNRSSVKADVAAATASFKCNGKKVDEATCKASLVAGSKVHVRGTLGAGACTATTLAPVTATEVKLQ